MRTFTNLLYDICTVLGLFKEGENPAHKRKSTNFEMHQNSGINVIMRSVVLLMLKGYSVRSDGGSYMPDMNILLHDEFLSSAFHTKT